MQRAGSRDAESRVQITAEFDFKYDVLNGSAQNFEFVLENSDALT